MKCVFPFLSFFFKKKDMVISVFCKEKCNFLSTVLRKWKEEREETSHEQMNNTAPIKMQTLGSNRDSGFYSLKQKIHF